MAEEEHGDLTKPDPTLVRFLTPEMCVIHLGMHDALHVTVKDERIYGGVYAAKAFPAQHPEGYISLVYSGGEGDEVEIGIIRDLSEFPEHAVRLVRQALARRYFIHEITEMKSVSLKYGYVYLEVETNKGPTEFYMLWSYNRAISHGKRGKILIDLDENRYLIPDVRKLPVRQREAFQRYIYW